MSSDPNPISPETQAAIDRARSSQAEAHARDKDHTAASAQLASVKDTAAQQIAQAQTGETATAAAALDAHKTALADAHAAILALAAELEIPDSPAPQGLMPMGSLPQPAPRPEPRPMTPPAQPQPQVPPGPRPVSGFAAPPRR
jgi:hypothetical protein